MEGYARTAAFMHQNGETAIFRHFGKLSIQNILYLQAEIVELEYDLAQLVERDKRSGHPNRQHYAKDWWYLSHSERDKDVAQWQKVLEIRAKLKEYHSALKQHALFLKLGGPSNYDLQILQDWILTESKLEGRDHSAWKDAADLVALSEAKYDDLFSRLIRKHLLPLYHRFFGIRLRRRCPNPSSSVATGTMELNPAGPSVPPPTPDAPRQDVYPLGGFSKYSDARLIAIIEVISTVISSMLPISSIIVLYFVTSLAARLGIILGYTALFSISLAIFTKARRVEIFAATSTFAAVQVVFISNGGSKVA